MLGLIFNAFERTFQPERADYRQIETELKMPSLQYRTLSEEDVTNALELEKNSQTQLERAKKYTTAIRNSVLNETEARGEFIRKFGGLRSTVEYRTKTAYGEVQAEERKLAGLLAHQRHKLRGIYRQHKLNGEAK